MSLGFSMGVVVAVVGVLVLLGLSGFVYIRENEVGVVIKRYGKPLPDGRIVALNGEAGYQADSLAPGWHFTYWFWQYKVEKVPVVQIDQGQIALLVAEDGDQLPNSQILGSEVDCDDFQNARKFLTNGGQKGRQLGLLKTGIYRINTALFTVITVDNCKNYGLEAEDLMVVTVPTGHVGVVTTQDGKALPKGRIAGSSDLRSHDSFQDAQKFLKTTGTKGLQEEVLLAGSYNLNPWFVMVETEKMMEIPIAHVGVVISSSGETEEDISGEDFNHGNLVKVGDRGIWNDPILPGQHALNPKIHKVELVPTSNVVLNWADEETASHDLDKNLSSIKVRAKDGFSFSLDVSQIIHVAAKDASKVISRVGTMNNLVEHVLQPIIGNYFRNAAQNSEILDFINTRSDKQKQASEHIRTALEEYNVVGVDTLIGDLVPPEELMKTLTDRKVAKEQQSTLDIQQQTEKRRQEFLKEKSLAEQQERIVQAQQAVTVAESKALEDAKRAEGEGKALTLKAKAEAESISVKAKAEAEAIEMKGKATAEAYTRAVSAMGQDNYAAMEIMKGISDSGVKITPDVLVQGGNGENSSGTNGLVAAVLSKTMLNEQKPNASKSDKTDTSKTDKT